MAKVSRRGRRSVRRTRSGRGSVRRTRRGQGMTSRARNTVRRGSRAASRVLKRTGRVARRGLKKVVNSIPSGNATPATVETGDGQFNYKTGETRKLSYTY